jgi:hypothetical protein
MLKQPKIHLVELVDELRQWANLLRRQADVALRHEPPESGDC